MPAPVSFARVSCALLGSALLGLTAHAQIPLLSAQQQLEPTDAEVFPTPDELVPVGFGTDVAVEGGHALISLPHADKGAGRIAIFKRNPTGEWQRTGRLRFTTKPDGVSAVELRGGMAVVASNNTIYVFRPAANGSWQQVRKFTVDAGELIHDVKYDGATAIVGTRFGPAGDAVYVFQIDRAIAARRQKLSSPSGSPMDEFGTSVAVFGNTFVVGAPGFNNGQGAAYIYRRRGTRWMQSETVLAADGEAGDRFGAGLAVRNNLIVVGAPGADPVYGGEFDELQRIGAAFVFAPRRGHWAQSQKLRPTQDGVGSFTAFGRHIDASGGRIVIGAPGVRGLTFDAGSLFIYTRHGRMLHRAQQAIESNELGYSFSIDDNTVIAGIVEPTFFIGRALVYELSRQ